MKFRGYLKRIDVEIEKEDGQVTKMVLMELNGDQRGDYLNSMSERMNIGPDGKPTGVPDFKGLESNLLSKCLVDENGKPVTVEFVQALPASTIQGLFEAASDLSGLTETAAEEVKKV